MLRSPSRKRDRKHPDHFLIRTAGVLEAASEYGLMKDTCQLGRRITMQRCVVLFGLLAVALMIAPKSARSDEKDEKIKALEKVAEDLRVENTRLKGDAARKGGQEVFRKEYGIGEGHPTEIVEFTIEPGDLVSVTASGVVHNGHPTLSPSGPKGRGGPAPN